MNGDLAGLFQLRNDPVQSIPAFADTKQSFDLTALTGFEPFQFLLTLPFHRIRMRFTELWTVHVDSVLGTKLEVFPGPEDGIG